MQQILRTETKIFNNSGNSFREYLKDAGKKILLKDNDFVFEKKQIAKGIYMIEKGLVKIFSTWKNNKENILFIAKDNDFLGIHAVLNNSLYHHSAKVIEATSLIFIPKKKIAELERENPSLNMYLLELLCKEIKKVEDKIISNSHKSSRQRLANTFIYLSNIHGNGNKIIPLSYEDIANMSCTSSTYFSRILGEFSKNKWIDLSNHRITILNKQKLLKVAEES